MGMFYYIYIREVLLLFTYHILSWLISLVLFIVGVLSPNTKITNIISMILRVFYLLIIGTGLYLGFNGAVFSIALLTKIIGSLGIIYSYEMILSKKKKGNTIKSLSIWIPFLVAWAIVIISINML